MKTNEVKLERIRKRHANITRFPRPVGDRKVNRKYRRVGRPMGQHAQGVGVIDPPDDCHAGNGLAVGVVQGEASPTDGQSGSGAVHLAADKITLTRDKLDRWFRFSKAQFQPDDQVYVNSWGYGVVKGIVKGRIQVFAPQFGATGATIYVGYERLQRVG